MLPELIKLSKELFEMDLIKESLEIDDMIHKLYGVGGNLSDDNSSQTFYSEEEEYNPQHSLDSIREIFAANSNREDFGSELSEILIESMSVDGLEILKESISQYLE